jgi:hypothetical protein
MFFYSSNDKKLAMESLVLAFWYSLNLMKLGAYGVFSKSKCRVSVRAGIAVESPHTSRTPNPFGAAGRGLGTNSPTIRLVLPLSSG